MENNYDQHLQALPNRAIVEPIYAGNKYGRSGLIIPDMAQETRPAMADIISAGRDFPYKKGERILLRPSAPNVGIPIEFGHGMRILIETKDAVGLIVGAKLYPPEESVLIVPDWRTKYRQPSSLIYLPPSVLEQNQPVQLGVVCRAGTKCAELRVGDYVVYPYTGIEVGFIDTVYYIIPEKDILGKVDAH